MTDAIRIDEFPVRTSMKLRYSDTDRQGHVNNTVFVTLLEAGRVDLFYDPAAPMADPGTSFVIVRLELDYRKEMHWPGEIGIGTRVLSVGRSSFRIEQALFQGDACVATSESVLVLMDDMTRKSTPLSPTTVARLEASKR
ncbi:acyl-CoA thioesterase [Flavisphingomonas formosensis]|uniref:acyl-CoA thioesterase n=1 Tax=Flavisphingomonas formosensis TaxID=861534 RepID=UPI0012FA683D|nr:thioesterase family protein [Sphingomonas formosensis]